jgi:ribosomal protein S18 acetylase RimI-like enzyme
MTSDLERAVAFEVAVWDTCAERIVPSSLGTAVFNDTLHRVWSLNVLRVENANASAEEMAAEAERLQGEAGLLHRRVFVADSEAGRELEEPFTALGWKTDAFVFMVPGREPNREVDLSAVVEVEGEILGPLEEAIIRETLPDVDEETVHQIQEANRLVAEAGRARHFAVVVDGIAVSSTDLYSDGRTAQIEDVGTLPEYRGHGYASAVVLRALAEARAANHDLVFLVADARNWPRELYRRLGFDPVGETYAYLRSLVEAG